MDHSGTSEVLGGLSLLISLPRGGAGCLTEARPPDEILANAVKSKLHRSSSFSARARWFQRETSSEIGH